MTDRLRRLWADDAGAVLTTEYLLLGSIMSFGAATGLNAMNDAFNAEAKAYAQSVHTLNQSYSVPAQSNCGGQKAGSQFIAPAVNTCP